MTSRGDSSWNGEVTRSVCLLPWLWVGVPRDDAEDADAVGAMGTEPAPMPAPTPTLGVLERCRGRCGLSSGVEDRLSEPDRAECGVGVRAGTDAVAFIGAVTAGVGAETDGAAPPTPTDGLSSARAAGEDRCS